MLPGSNREMKAANSNHRENVETEQLRSCVGTACTEKEKLEKSAVIMTISSNETTNTNIVKESGSEVVYALRARKAHDSNAIHTPRYPCMLRHVGKRKRKNNFPVLKKQKQSKILVDWVQCDKCKKWRIVSEIWTKELFECSDISRCCSDICDHEKGRHILA